MGEYMVVVDKNMPEFTLKCRIFSKVKGCSEKISPSGVPFVGKGGFNFRNII